MEESRDARYGIQRIQSRLREIDHAPCYLCSLWRLELPADLPAEARRGEFLWR